MLRSPRQLQRTLDDFARTSSPSFAWGNLTAMFKSLPGLRGFWPMSAVTDLGGGGGGAAGPLAFIPSYSGKDTTSPADILPVDGEILLPDNKVAYAVAKIYTPADIRGTAYAYVRNTTSGANPYCRLYITANDPAWKPGDVLTGGAASFDTGYLNTGVLNPSTSNDWLILPLAVSFLAGSVVYFYLYRDALDANDNLSDNLPAVGFVIGVGGGESAGEDVFYYSNQGIQARNNAVWIGFGAPPQHSAGPASPSIVTDVWALNGFVGVIARDNYLYSMIYSTLGGQTRGIHRMDLSGPTDVVYNLLTLTWGAARFWGFPEHSLHWSVLDDNTVVAAILTQYGDGVEPEDYFIEFIKYNVATGAGETLIGQLPAYTSNWDNVYVWHHCIVNNLLIVHAWFDDTGPAPDVRGFRTYIFDIDNGTSSPTGAYTANVVWSYATTPLVFSKFMQWPICQHVQVAHKFYVPYTFGSVGSESVAETSKIFVVDFDANSQVEVPIIKDGKPLYAIYCMNYRPIDDKIYFITYLSESGLVTWSIARMSLTSYTVEYIYSRSSVFPPTNVAPDAPQWIVPGETELYVVLENGNVLAMGDLTTVVATVPQPSSYSTWPPDFPGTYGLSNIVDNADRLWYIEDNDVKAKDVTDGSLVVNIDANLPVQSGANAGRALYVWDSRVFILNNSATSAALDRIYRVT